MPPKQLQEKLRHKPFRPFRMHLTDGTAYDVLHPELIMLGRRYLVLGLTRDPEETLIDSSVDIDLLHIVRVETLKRGDRRGGNGRSQGDK